MARNTRTGVVMERMILPALEEAGYACCIQAFIGKRLGCGKHIADAIVSKGERRFIVSVKWQQVSGTAEQKVPFEAMCLAEAMESGGYEKAYIVIGGEGWKLRDFYIRGGIHDYIPRAARVEVISLEGFIGKVNRGLL